MIRGKPTNVLFRLRESLWSMDGYLLGVENIFKNITFSISNMFSNGLEIRVISTGFYLKISKCVSVEFNFACTNDVRKSGRK